MRKGRNSERDLNSCPADGKRRMTTNPPANGERRMTTEQSCATIMGILESAVKYGAMAQGVEKIQSQGWNIPGRPCKLLRIFTVDHGGELFSHLAIFLVWTGCICSYSKSKLWEQTKNKWMIWCGSPSGTLARRWLVRRPLHAICNCYTHSSWNGRVARQPTSDPQQLEGKTSRLRSTWSCYDMQYHEWIQCRQTTHLAVAVADIVLVRVLVYFLKRMTTSNKFVNGWMSRWLWKDHQSCGFHYGRPRLTALRPVFSWSVARKAMKTWD